MAESTVQWSDISQRNHDVLFRFETAFKECRNPQINDYLTGEGPSRWQLLLELLHSDLELRLRDKQAIRVLDYLHRYPELTSLPNEVAALLATEIRILQQLGHEVQQRQYESEYGSLLGQRIRSVFKAAGMELPDIPGYDVFDVIGKGGMGQVYRARHLQLRRDVAIKVIRPDRVTSELEAERYRERFRKEATAVAGVNHPHVVQIYEIGENAGTLFLAMELVEGNSLQKLIDTQGVFSPRTAAELFIRIAQGVQAVHDQQLIHRDLKPDNILINRAGEPKITDFGLARPFERDVEETQPGDVVGTPIYMSPEQASLGEEKLTPKVDVYGLGATLYCALTGRAPYPRESVKDTLKKVLKGEILPVSHLRQEVPADLDNICLKCLSTEPGRRYSSPQKLAEDLQAFLDGRPVQARPLSAWGRTYRWVKRHPLATAMIVVSVASLLAITVLSMFGIREATRRQFTEQAREIDGFRSKVNLAHEVGNNSEVIAKFNEAQSLGIPLSPACYMQCMDAQLALYNVPEAMRILQQLKQLQLPPEIQGRVALLEGTHLLGEDNTRAQQLIKHAIELGLNPADLLFARAMQKDKTPEAADLCKQAIEKDSRHLQARSMAGILLVSMGFHDEAIEIAKLTATLYPQHPNPNAVLFLAFALQGKEQLAAEQLSKLKTRMPETVAKAFEQIMPHLCYFRANILVNTNGSYHDVFPDYQSKYLKNNKVNNSATFLVELMKRFATKNPQIAQTFAGWVPPAALSTLQFNWDLFDPTKLFLYGFDLVTALNSDTRLLARVRDKLKEEPEGFVGFLYAMTLMTKANGVNEKLSALAAKAPLTNLQLAEIQSKFVEAADAYYLAGAGKTTGHFIDVRPLSLEGAALCYAMASSERYPGEKNPVWKQRLDEVIRLRLSHEVPCLPSSYEFLFNCACSVGLYETAYTLGLKIPDLEHNKSILHRCPGYFLFFRDYRRAFETSNLWLIKNPMDNSPRAIDLKRIRSESWDKLRTDYEAVQKNKPK